ncbi:hypothetical protein LINPERPRIM_LOCUS15620 [Linum perenne]
MAIRDRAESYTDWVLILLEEGRDQLIDLSMAISWAIWKERNERVWSQKASTAQRVVRQAKESVQEWLEARSTPAAAPNPQTAVCSRWHPPIAPDLKCNLDAATFAHLRRTGIGICLRNSLGQLLGYRMLTINGGLSVAEGEGFALLEAMNWCQQMGLQNVHFESDAKLVLDKLHSQEPDSTELRDLMNRCRRLLSTHPSFKATFVRRSSNRTAHTLARNSCYFYFAFHRI